MNLLYSTLMGLFFKFWLYDVTIICLNLDLRSFSVFFFLKSRLVHLCLPATSVVVTLWAWQALEQPVASPWGGLNGMYVTLCTYSLFNSAE